MKYSPCAANSVKQVSESRIQSVLWVLCFLAMLVHPSVMSASAGVTQDNGDLYLSCRADNDCVLSSTPIGEEQVSGQTFATLVQPEVITFEFLMDPAQRHIALVPEVLEELEIDFKHQTEAGSLFRPAMELRLVVGSSVNDWSFEPSTLPEFTAQTYRLENEPLDLSDGRVLWVDEPVRLVFTVTIDRPGTWSLNMRGPSFLRLDVPWSIDPEAVDVDEPSSSTQPVLTDFEDIHQGALIGADTDCWSFEVETHEVLRLLVEWVLVPVEIEQPHPIPDLITAAGRLSPTPDVVVEDNGEALRMTYRWRALPTGDYNLCFYGSQDKIQPYSWIGTFGYESMGPTDPTGFNSTSFYPQGAALVGELDEPLDLANQGFGMLLFSLLAFVAFIAFAWQPTTALVVRYGLFVPGVLMLFVGGIVHPIWAISDEVQHPEEITIDDLLEMRLQQLWDVSAEGVPERTVYTHTGATWGMLDGERLKLKLDIEKAIPMNDGRWQLVVTDLATLRLDRAIFGQVSEGAKEQPQTGMLENQAVRFILLAGRSLLLDLLMLEAMLVVDEPPMSSVFHIDVEMVSAPASGSVGAPAWATRPATVDANDWVRLQAALFPDRISVSLCDCDLDLLDVTFQPSSGFDEADIPPSWGVDGATGLTPYGGAVMFGGFILGVAATATEVRRKAKAAELAHHYAAQGAQSWD